MSAFEYTVLDKLGKEKNGVLEGDTAKQIRQQLRDQGLTPLSVKPVTHLENQSKYKGSRRTISALDLALITRQMAALLKSGLPLEEVLRAVAKQTDKPRIEKVVLAVRAKVREGHPLAAGFAEFPNIFPEIYRKTVQAGEESGHLDAVLDRLAEYTENRHKIKQQTTLALFYPLLLTIVAFGIVAAMLAFIVPDIVQVFDSVDQELPALTRGIISISDFMRDYWLLSLLGLIMLVVLLKAFFSKPAARFALHKAALKLPFIGKLINTSNSARFSQTLGILSASNVPILTALTISGEVLSNLPMRKAVKNVAVKIREGISLHQALEQTGYFSPMTISLVASGEVSGNLEEMLQRAADIQQREVEAFITTLVRLFEPILILVMGALVMTIVLGLMIPIIDMNTIIR